MPRFFSRNYNSSLKFNGSSNYVTLGTSGSIAQASAAFSLACWVKLNASSTGLIFTPVGDITGSLNRFYLQISDNKVTTYVKTSGTSASLSGNNVIPLNTWVHLVMTYDGANVRVYINAVLDQTVVCTGSCTSSASGMAIGRGFAGTRYHNGNIARVQYWNARALSLAEIQEIYFNGADESSASIRSGMTGEWKLDEGTGSTAIDTFGSNNGTITGATYDSDVPFESKFIQRNANAAILANGADGAAGNILSVPFSATLNPTAAVTLEIWFRPTALKAGILFDNSTVGTTNSYFLSMGADGSMNWFSTIGGLSKTIVGTAKKAKFFEWNCVSATYNGSAVLIFLNGSQLAETLAASGALGTNSGPLRIGAYYSGGISATFLGNLSQPRVYAAGCTLAEHQDRYYRGITSAALQAGLVLDLNTQLGAGSTVTDLSGLGNNATMGASASWTSDSPFKARKASVNANMVKNGNFEYAPPFTAATTTDARWIDGTSGGSTTNNLFGWKLASTSLSPTVTSISAAYTSVAGRNCMQIVSVGGMRKSGATVTGLGAFNTAYTGSTLAETDRSNLIPVQPNTSYLASMDYYNTQIDTGVFPSLAVVEYNAALTRGVTTSGSGQTDISVDWRTRSFIFTTASTANYIGISGRCQAGGSSDFDNGNCTISFDNISLTPVYPEGRVPANGNLVKNFDFEVAPPFTAETITAARWIDGTSGGSTTNSTYKWATVSGAITPSASVSYDTTVFHSGTASLKLSTLNTAGAAVAANTLNTASPADTNVLLRLLPSTAYTLNFYLKTNNVATNGAYAFIREYSGSLGILATTNSTKLSGTNDWTLITLNFTTNASTQLASLALLNNVPGNISDAWFDDIYLAPTTNPGRIAIT